MSLSSIHIDYNHSPVQALNPLYARCEPLVISFGTEAVGNNRVLHISTRKLQLRAASSVCRSQGRPVCCQVRVPARHES
eukprot:1142985-Prymnesium_polylepis.1